MIKLMIKVQHVFGVYDNIFVLFQKDKRLFVVYLDFLQCDTLKTFIVYDIRKHVCSVSEFLKTCMFLFLSSQLYSTKLLIKKKSVVSSKIYFKLNYTRTAINKIDDPENKKNFYFSAIYGTIFMFFLYQTYLSNESNLFFLTISSKGDSRWFSKFKFFI